MSAPPRLTDDPSISEALRSDLRNAAATEARAFDAQRGLEALRASLGGLPVPSAPPPSSGLGPTFWGVTGIGTAIVIGAILAGGYSMMSDAPDAETTVTRTPLVVERADEVPAPIEAPVAPAVEMPVVVEETPAPRPRRAVAPAAVVVGPPSQPAEDPDALLRREMSQLQQIRTLLSRDPSEALRLAEEGHREFPHGMFREEREAVAVLSLARLGRPETQARAIAFLREHPRGPFSEEIRRLAPRP